LYSAQLEDLASHGYIVAGVENASSTFRVFRDGRVAGYDPERWRNNGKSPDERIAIEQENTDRMATELVLALNTLTGRARAARDASILNRVDRTRIGVFGHSYGARVAIRACQVESRFRACLNQDGLSQGYPFHKDPSGKPVMQPVLFLLRKSSYLPELTITDVALAKEGTTREAAAKQAAEVKGKIIETLSSVSGGATWLSIDVSGISHMSYTDLPLLGAASADERRHHVRALEVIREQTRQFFDRHVKGVQGGDGLRELRPPEVTKVFESNPARRY
jgi:dienelactone hydrolase